MKQLQANELTTKKKNIVIFLIVGNIMIFFSIFLPTVIITDPFMGQVSYNAFGSPLTLFFLFGFMVFGFLTIKSLNLSLFKEDILKTRNFALVSAILGSIGIVLFDLEYSFFPETNSSPISPSVIFGIGFYGIIVGFLLNLVGFILIINLTYQIPSKVENNNLPINQHSNELPKTNLSKTITLSKLQK